MIRRFFVAFATLLSFAACDYPRVIMSPEPKIHPATDRVAAISSKVDQALSVLPSLKTRRCKDAYEWKGAVQAYAGAALRKDGETARRAASQLHRYLGCLSARDFVTAARRFEELAMRDGKDSGDEQIRGAVDEILAPLVFMIHDMGERTAGRGYRKWLIARKDQLLRAATNKSSFLSTLGMFGTYGDYLRTVKPVEALTYVTELGSLSGRCAYFEMAHIDANISFCPRDCALLANFEVADGLQSTSLGGQLQELCNGHNTLNAAISPELRGQLRSCGQEYAKAIQRPDVAVCVDISSNQARGGDGLYRTSFRRQVHVLDDCSVATQSASPTARSDSQQAVRGEMDKLNQQIGELRRSYRELSELYSRCLDFGHGEACTSTLGHAVAVVNKRMDALSAQIQAQRAQLTGLSTAVRCRLDGSGCSTHCDISGQLLNDQDLCFPAGEGGQAQAPASQPPHELSTRPPKPDSPVAALSSCVRAAFAAAAVEQPLCNKSILCGDGSAPQPDGNACICGFKARAVVSRESCETVIHCPSADRLCRCDGIELPGVFGAPSSSPPATLLTSLSP